MPLVINSNAAATMAANNLAASNTLLQRSLNRLSSGSKIVNPADDAGGLAVSMKLASTAKRMGASSANLGNSVSYLQTQDGALKVAGKVLERIGELKTLASDPTKNASDLANYGAEFAALQAQLSSIGSETFNGTALFGSSSLSVGATAAPDGSTIEFGAADLLGGGAGAPAFTTYNQDFTTFILGLANDYGYTASGGTATVSGGNLILDVAASGYIDVGLNNPSSFSGAMEIVVDLTMSAGNANTFSVGLGSNTLATLTNGTDIAADGAAHTLRITLDAAGNASAYLDGATTAYQTTTGLGTSGSLELINTDQGTTTLDNLTVTSTPTSSTQVDTIANAASLASLDIGTIKSALQEVATHRANNGAQQSRLGFADELLSINKANLEAANSRITDVDVAEESTQLARYNILVQAGTSMLTQANQSAQNILRLLS